MKENLTCRNVFTSNWSKIFVMNFINSNEVVNFFSNDETIKHHYDIGVWKIKTKKIEYE